MPLKALQAILSSIKIGDPIAALLRPAISLDQYDERTLALGISFLSVDAETGRRDFPVRMIKLLCTYEVSSYIKEPAWFVQYVYTLLLNLLQHELNESFRFNNEYFIHPHPEDNK
jgi:hypothetical protein